MSLRANRNPEKRKDRSLISEEKNCETCPSKALKAKSIKPYSNVLDIQSTVGNKKDGVVQILGVRLKDCDITRLYCIYYNM